jgi:hypothetical protein
MEFFFSPHPMLVLPCVSLGLVIGHFPIEGALPCVCEQILKPGRPSVKLLLCSYVHSVLVC